MATLTKTELKTAELIAWGASDKEVASEMCRSFDTIRTHRKNIYSKTGARNAADLTRWFFQYKGVQLGIPPVTRFILTGLFLVLAVAMEFMHADAIRVRRAKTAKVMRAKTRTRSKSTYQL